MSSDEFFLLSGFCYQKHIFGTQESISPLWTKNFHNRFLIFYSWGAGSFLDGPVSSIRAMSWLLMEAKIVYPLRI